MQELNLLLERLKVRIEEIVSISDRQSVTLKQVCYWLIENFFLWQKWLKNNSNNQMSLDIEIHRLLLKCLINKNELCNYWVH